MTTGLAKCPRASCKGNLIRDFEGREICSLCSREYGVPLWLVQPKPEHEPHWNRQRKCVCATRTACQAHPEPAA